MNCTNRPVAQPGSGNYIATVKVGQKGQIVIPKTTRDLLCIASGDTLLLHANLREGIALQPFGMVKNLFDDLFKK